MKLDKNYIIAEAGVNHNGCIETAIKLVEVAAEAGVDAIKFQTFKSELVVTPFAKKAEYQLKQTEGSTEQLNMLKALELKKADYQNLYEISKKYNLDFLSTAFDLESLEFLVSLGVKKLKVASGEVTNGPLLLASAQTGLPIILSCGIATINEIKTALSVLAFGYLYPRKKPATLEECLGVWDQEAAQNVLKEKIVLLHCTSAYPAAFNEVNLRAMQTLAETFKLSVGYSDHTLGILVPTLAVASGALVIEKHFTLDKSMSGPDHAASLAPHELKEMVQQIRLTETILGTKEKQPTVTESLNKKNIRRGLYASKEIGKGEAFGSHNLVALRPENDISPMQFWDLHAKIAPKAYGIFEEINEC